MATGGLGPTADDLTRDAVAQAIGVELVFDEPSFEHIRALFARHNRPMPERNRLQAMFPAGSRPIDNPGGTAPGIWLEAARPGRAPCRLFALPGVPAEMREMFAATVAPAVAALLGEPRLIRHRRIKCFGAGESQLEEMLPDLIRRGRSPSVGITVHEATITLRITASGRTDEECLAAMRPTEETIRQALGVLVFGSEDDELQDVVLRLLAERRQTVSTVEWGTRGRLARWLAAATANHHCLAGSLVIDSLSAVRARLVRRCVTRAGGWSGACPLAGRRVPARFCVRLCARDRTVSRDRSRRCRCADRSQRCRGRIAIERRRRIPFRLGHGRNDALAFHDDGSSSRDLGTPRRQAGAQSAAAASAAQLANPMSERRARAHGSGGGPIPAFLCPSIHSSGNGSWSRGSSVVHSPQPFKP